MLLEIDCGFIKHHLIVALDFAEFKTTRICVSKFIFQTIMVTFLETFRQDHPSSIQQEAHYNEYSKQ